MNVDAYKELTGYQLNETRDNWKSLCPAHVEKTPSFYIHRETYLCHCFGCGVRGYLDSVLARSLEVSAGYIRRTLDIPAISRLERIEKQEPSFEAVWVAGFPRILNHPFLEARGFGDNTVTHFQTRWDSKERRLVFPLISLGDNVVGAVGRSLRPDQEKWYTYWNALKGNLLYSPHGPEDTSLIIVEGIFDAMWLYQHGYYSVAALIGANASRTQVELIKASAHEVILFLDNDKAGILCQNDLAKKLKSSLKVSIARYPNDKPGADPQELTAKELDEAIEDRCSYVQYMASK